MGGTNLTRDFPISRTLYQDVDYPQGLTTFDLFSDTHSFIAGISVEVDLVNSLSIEANALHRTLNLKRRFILPDGSLLDAGRVSVPTWEFPVLLKYRLPAIGAARPFIEGGPSFRTRHNPAPTEPSQFGATAGIGAEFRRGRFRLAPAIRYTRWQYDGDFPRFATKRDQFEFVTAVSYATSMPSWKLGGKKLRVGVIGGLAITGGLEKGAGPPRLEEEQGYVAGLAVELDLNQRFTVEVNGLYKPLRAHTISDNPFFGRVTFEFTVLTWQFPVLAKYRLRPASKLQPIIEAGPSFRLSGNLNGYNPSSYGFTVGAGVETRYNTAKIGPTLRYTRWADDQRTMLGGGRTNRDQLELLVSLTF